LQLIYYRITDDNRRTDSDKRTDGDRRTGSDNRTDYNRGVYSDGRINGIKTDNNRRKESYRKS
jgi:hypothetical protein